MGLAVGVTNGGEDQGAADVLLIGDLKVEQVEPKRQSSEPLADSRGGLVVRDGGVAVERPVKPAGIKEVGQLANRNFVDLNHTVIIARAVRSDNIWISETDVRILTSRGMGAVQPP